MENGWIKIHRKLKEKGYYKKSTYVHLWIHLLLSANREPKEFMWNNDIVIVNEGQLITGRKTLSDETGIPESTIEDILNFLERQHQIQQEKNTKYRLITILNWKTHQTSDSKSNNRATTEQQQADTNKNHKKYKKEEKNTYGEFENVRLTSKEYEKLVEQSNEGFINSLIVQLDTYIESTGKKYASHYATIQNWGRRKAMENKQKVESKKSNVAFT